MILAVGEVLMEFRRVEADGEVALPGSWQVPFCSGAPAIFASVAARLGARAGLAGAVGADAFGRMLRERLERDGVDTAALTGKSTTKKIGTESVSITKDNLSQNQDSLYKASC